MRGGQDSKIITMTVFTNGVFTLFDILIAFMT